MSTTGAKLGRRLVASIFAGLAWVGSHELSVLLSAVVLSAGAWAFVELADEVTEGESLSIDETVLLSLRNSGDLSDPIGPGWVEEMGRDFTALGSMGVLTLITLAVLGYLLLAGRNRASLFTLVAVAGGMLLSTLLKMGFDRARPDLVPHDTVVYTASFPSGHSMMAAVTYLTLAAILSRGVPSDLEDALFVLRAEGAVRWCPVEHVQFLLELPRVPGDVLRLGLPDLLHARVDDPDEVRDGGAQCDRALQFLRVERDDVLPV